MSDFSKPSPYSISLRTILLFSTAIFIIGYQQFQLQQVHDSLTELRQSNDGIRQQLKQMQQTPSIQVISATGRTLGGQGQLRFPVEVERAMMGDAIRAGMPVPLTPQRVR